MTDHYERSVDLIEDVLEARAALQDLYSVPADGPRDARVVARLNGVAGDSMKLAEVHATLAVAQSLDEIRAALEQIR